MSLFRSKKDIAFAKRIAHELIEKIIGESVTYYAISKKFNNANFYGESKNKIFDPPVQIYAMIEWLEQETSTTKFGQDVIYNIKINILDEHLYNIDMDPKEGDIVEYDSKFFEVTERTSPKLFFGKENEEVGIQLLATSIRKGNFDTIISGSTDQPIKTSPDPDTRQSYFYGMPQFANSGSSL